MFRRIFESRFAWIVTIIPVLNLLYVLLLLLYKEKITIYKLIVFLLVGAGIFQLNRIMPDQWRFLPLYLVTVLFSVASFISLKKSKPQVWEISGKKRILLVILSSVLVCLIGLSAFIVNKTGFDRKTTSVITAIVRNNASGFQAEMYNHNRSLQDTIDSLNAEGILLSGTVKKQRRTAFQTSSTGHTQIIEAEYEYLIGGIPYVLNVIYQSDDHSSGFTSILITPCDPENTENTSISQSVGDSSLIDN